MIDIPNRPAMEWIDIPNQPLATMECVDISNQLAMHGMRRHLQPTCNAWNASTSPTNLVGARAVGSGWVGLHGRPWGGVGQSPVNQNVACLSPQTHIDCHPEPQRRISSLEH